MGSAISRCASRGSSRLASDYDDEKILGRQPNWLVPPALWRSRSKTSSGQPVRYRTPTPYPKGDRKPLPHEPQHVRIHIQEKTASTIVTPVVNHLEVASAGKHSRKPQQTSRSIRQPSNITITWESPVTGRLNRFER
ncbi:uncharacterized protein CTHT_0018670 [Thermochaetoides thermophila DSM 1495]|uniref:Uncharacterized protein n=1 Tax=Chaetomium thermophilum (strain DSM 1495 / CBS 144.50 / IMI 039719) TaxID=759272 RepID=G0S2W0_CHATD|nr:hypothetical protein CTHT_0018670 [Thermochaetoides thermophila DSM 1495]EGS22343.1 hypothetical protein CTHT_0018670 [Thermochaetoides thermophila DSM 1495]